MLHNSINMFKKRENIAEIEEGNLLSPKFDNEGLIPVVTTCSNTKEILLFVLRLLRLIFFEIIFFI